MRIIATKNSSGTFDFRVESLKSPDEIIVKTPNGKSLHFQNVQPPRVEYTKRAEWFWQRDKDIVAPVDWPRSDYVHFLCYSTDGRETNCYAPLNVESPLWKCVKWVIYEDNVFMWNFVTQKLVHYALTPLDEWDKRNVLKKNMRGLLE